MKLSRLAKTLASDVNVKRRAKGLLPRPVCPFLIAKKEKSYVAKLSNYSLVYWQVRAGIVGYPNVGKSSLINRLLKRRMCPAAPRPGVTRELK